MFITDATSLPRLMVCNGSRLMGGSLPPMNADDPTHRDEGTAAHYLARAVFHGEFNIDELVDRKAPNGVYITAEMAEAVQSYLDAIIVGSNRLVGGMEIETSHAGIGWQINGRADYIDFVETTLYIDEFKYGWSIVEPEMNWTMISHAIGHINRVGIQPDWIKFTVHQPRPAHRDGKHRSWTISYENLRALASVLGFTLSNLADTLQTSPHCHDCPALAICPAARQATMNAIDVAEKMFEDDISDEELSFTLDQLARASAMIEQRLEATREFARHRIRAGKVVQNYSLERVYGHRVWNDGLDANILQALTGKSLTAKPKLVSPAQAEKLGVPKEVVKTLAHSPETGVKLVRVDANKKATRLLGERKEE